MVARIPWADLPSEVLSLIAEHLETGSAIRQFRAVCRSWRSSCPPPPYLLSPLLPYKLSSTDPPHGIFSYILKFVKIPSVIFSSNICLLLPYQDQISENHTKPWLVCLEEFNSGKLRIRFPLTNKRIRNLFEYFPRKIMLSGFRFIEAHKGYNFTGRNIFPGEVDKVVMFSDPESKSATSAIDDFTAMVLCGSGLLYAVTLRNERWKCLRYDWDSRIDDIISFKGQIYAVDRRGKLWIYYRTLLADSVSDPICEFHVKDTRKHLVEFSGELYLVRRNEYKLEVYKLNERGCRWDPIENFGDRLLFVGTDYCFFASTEDFPGWKGNCIVFHMESFISYGGTFYPNDSLQNNTNQCSGVCIFYLGDDRCWPISTCVGYSDILWPPPTWFRSCNEDQIPSASTQEAANTSSSPERSNTRENRIIHLL